ncbi:deoxyribose-phosphate aldolase [Xylocopilactobacillus apis]|uniref:Deoxyribose-phosphate aldolase n=1 Tax=Xylocopilactobacillus apis TaxID=2932183 RepID=A0AAU9D851_9LACO|nr:deoxyribose-phosphate aldolase [Xylocopilactobacillus apis]BDR55845.1 deoxyribose-phosphate aldolase [Xylocopilactobacillus apis]
MKTYKLNDFTKLIDVTNLNNCTTYPDLEKVCDEAKQNEFNSIIVHSGQVKFCADYLENSEVKVGAAVSFPHGQVSIPTKAFETEDVISNGAKEVEYVVNLTEFKAGHDDYVKTEMNVVWSLCQTWDIVGKVIINSNHLSKEEIERIAKIALEVKITAIKTDLGDKQLEDVRLIKNLVGDEIKIEATDPMASLEDTILLLEAGADRLSTANGVKILDEAKEKL